MNDAPERISVEADGENEIVRWTGRRRWGGAYCGEWKSDYIRADLAGLPEELVERTQACMNRWVRTRGIEETLLCDILEWDRKQKEARQP